MTRSGEGAALRVGLVGYGLGGAAFHAPLVASTPRLHLAAIVTADAERRGQAERAHPGARIVPDADALWNEPLDVAVIASPNRTHVPLALAALDRGLHVVVDKPVAASADDARRLAAHAAARGRLVVPYHNRRWDGDFLTVRRLLAEDAVGPVHRLESRFDRWRPALRGGWKESPAPEDATGLLYDLGTHLVDQALVLFGPVAAVYAELDRRRPDGAVDDDVFVALTHASGVRSHLWASVLAAQAAPRFRLLGARGAFVKHGTDPQEGALRAGERPGAEDWGTDPPTAWGTLGIDGMTAPVRTEAGAYHRFYERFAAALRGAGAPPVAMDDAIAGLEVIEAARRSATEGRTVTLRGAGR